MLMDLDKKDLEALVCGVLPNFSVIDHPKVKKHGQWMGRYDQWEWNRISIADASEEELKEVYLICKNSRDKSL